MRYCLTLILSLGVLGGCAPPAHLQSQPSTGFGTGATGYGATTPYGSPTTFGAPVAATPPGGIPSSEINSALFGTPAAPGSAVPGALPAAVPTATVTGAEAIPLQPAVNPGISDEQDFEAVSARESIESDKARIEANKAQYQVIQPTALPERGAAAGVSPIIEYALNAPNRLGEAVYERRAVSPEAHQKACLRYPTPEEAQAAFLKAGGPNRDGKKLDPDGDGYACDWDPTPFQQARGN